VSKKTLVLKALPYILVVMIAVLIISAAVPILKGGLDITTEGDIEVSINGAYIVANGIYVIDSDLPYDIKDVTVKVYIVDDLLNSRVNILTLDGITVKAHSVTEIELRSRAFIPSAFLILRDLVSREGSEVPIRVEFSGKYIFGLVGMDVRLDTNVRLAEPDSMLEYSIASEEDLLNIVLQNLNSDIPVSDYNISIRGGGATISVLVTKDGNTVTVSVKTSGEFIETIDKIRGSSNGEGPLVIDNLTANMIQIDPGDLGVALDILEYIWEDSQ
jgi:archaellum component FlaF (FlaF/FlaG flagellin family)